MNKVICIACVAAIVFSVFGLSFVADASFELPFGSDETIYIKYSTADYAPSGVVTAVGAIWYFEEQSGVDVYTLLRGYAFYQVVSENIICAVSRYDDTYGYIFWKDSSGSYQHLMWSKDGNEDDVAFDEAVDTTTAEPATMTGKEFSEICAQLQTHYAPSAEVELVSLQQTNNPRAALKLDMSGICEIVPFYDEGKFVNRPIGTPVYIVFFFDDESGNRYYSRNQYCFATYSANNSTLGSYTDFTYTIIDNFGDHEDETTVMNLNGNTVRWLDWCITSDDFEIWYYASYENYLNLNGQVRTIAAGKADYFVDAANPTTTIERSTLGFDKLFAFPYDDRAEYLPLDYGYIVSDSFIEMDGLFKDIDTTQIPANYYITINGDNIYDYDITNPDTGETSTVNEYITNNYTFITNNNGGDGTGGSVSGDVTVSGNIDVGGKVDININVNQDNGGSGSNVDPYDYVDVNLNEALEQIPEMGTGFTDFLQQIFTWLPAEVVGLIIGGIGIAILCRVAGR